MRYLSLASVLRWVEGWLSSSGIFLSLFFSWSISAASPRISSSFCLMSSYNANSSSFYERSTLLSPSLLPHSFNTSAACVISFLICSSMPRLPMELRVFNLAFPFLNYLSSESREECNLERESWVRLWAMVLMCYPMWLVFVGGLRVSRSRRFGFFYYIINITLNNSWKDQKGRMDGHREYLKENQGEQWKSRYFLFSSCIGD